MSLSLPEYLTSITSHCTSPSPPFSFLMNRIKSGLKFPNRTPGAAHPGLCSPNSLTQLGLFNNPQATYTSFPVAKALVIAFLATAAIDLKFECESSNRSRFNRALITASASNPL